jgi:hypothetical protein
VFALLVDAPVLQEDCPSPILSCRIVEPICKTADGLAKGQDLMFAKHPRPCLRV